ncbi:MAG: hypothetical protein ACTTH7_09780 [Treponema sp.]
MIESQILIQTELVKSANPLQNVIFVLDYIERGSWLTSLLRKYLKVENDNMLLEVELKGNIDEYIEQSNTIILNKLSDSTTKPITKDEVKNIISEIDVIADKTAVKTNDNFKLLADEKIIEGVIKAKKAVDTLPNRTYTFNPNKQKIEISKINLNIITEQSAGQKSIEQQTHHNMILKIKLADFLGESKWKFITPDKNQIDAKIIDKDWLERFHQNAEQLASGDCLDVEVDIKETDTQKSEYTITKVNKVISDERQREFEM